MDETVYYQRNQCQWIGLNKNIVRHSILEDGKQCLTKTVPKLKKREKNKNDFYNCYKNL